MREAVITQSPHAFVPKEHLTEEEREEQYRTRLDESFRPYTVIDVLTKVYHRNFADDLQTYIGQHPRDFKTTGEGWSVARAWVNELHVIRPESVFQQTIDDFNVDIMVEAKIRLEEVRSGAAFIRNRYGMTRTLRLRYSFDFRPCSLKCHFVRVILRDSESIHAVNPGAFPVDKYLIPVLRSEDYEELAREIQGRWYAEEIETDAPIEPIKWILYSNRKIFLGQFPENGALGEYFFGFGTADVIS